VLELYAAARLEVALHRRCGGWRHAHERGQGRFFKAWRERDTACAPNRA
jgi:hypothetical protein